jgi:hypothetical protein
VKGRFARRQVALTAAVGVFLIGATLIGCSPASGSASSAHAPSAHPYHSNRTTSPRASPPSLQPSVSGTPGSSGATVVLQTEELTLTPAMHLNFTGTGFSPGEMLVVTVLDSHGHVAEQFPSATADADGNITPVSQVMPMDLAPGTHLLLVKGESSQRTARAEFQVQRLPPTVQLDTYTAKPGYDFGVSGNGFTSNEQVEVILGSAKGMPLATLSASTGGDIAGRIKVPMLRAGEYPLYFVGRVSQSPASVGFDIQGFKPWVVFDSYAPEPGFALRFSGRDFAPGEQVLVYLTTPRGHPVTTLRADVDGTFTHAGSFVIPTTLTGHQTLVFVGEQSQASTTASFDILPTPSTPGGAAG